MYVEVACWLFGVLLVQYCLYCVPGCKTEVKPWLGKLLFGMEYLGLLWLVLAGVAFTTSVVAT